MAFLLWQHLGSGETTLDSVAALGVAVALVAEQGVVLEVALQLPIETVVVTLDEAAARRLGPLTAPAQARSSLRWRLLDLLERGRARTPVSPESLRVH